MTPPKHYTLIDSHAYLCQRINRDLFWPLVGVLGVVLVCILVGA